MLAPPLLVFGGYSLMQEGRTMNAVDMLKAQHRQVEKLFKAIEEASGEEKQALFFELADALAIHTTIEERHFYPGVNAGATEDLLREAVEEHLAAKRTLADLLDMEVDDAQFDAKLTVLKEQISHHVEEEEKRSLPQGEEDPLERISWKGSPRR